MVSGCIVASTDVDISIIAKSLVGQLCSRERAEQGGVSTDYSELGCSLREARHF